MTGWQEHPRRDAEGQDLDDSRLQQGSSVHHSRFDRQDHRNTQVAAVSQPPGVYLSWLEHLPHKEGRSRATLTGLAVFQDLGTRTRDTVGSEPLANHNSTVCDPGAMSRDSNVDRKFVVSPALNPASSDTAPTK